MSAQPVLECSILSMISTHSTFHLHKDQSELPASQHHSINTIVEYMGFDAILTLTFWSYGTSTGDAVWKTPSTPWTASSKLPSTIRSALMIFSLSFAPLNSRRKPTFSTFPGEKIILWNYRMKRFRRSWSDRKSCFNWNKPGSRTVVRTQWPSSNKRLIR